MADQAGRLDDGAERTVLTTDVVGSTTLLHRFPDDLILAMDQHDHILRTVICRHNGVPFKNTGDGVFAIFDQPAQAVLAAVEAQLAMRAAAWGPTGRLRVRYGLHIGLVRARGADYFGPALPTAARLQSAASGDQILISGELARRIEGVGDFERVDLGLHHFKGIDPIRVFQVSAVGLPKHFPPIGGKRQSANGNLPAHLTSFVGREAELQTMLAMTAETRLLTLVGPGGIGKTRLGVEFARSLAASYPDGAWMVDLTALERHGDVWPAIAAALLIEPLPTVGPRAQVIERLQNARAVLLMDNCEHVLDQIAQAVFELGSACESVFIINTSRRNLAVEGEAVFEVPPLHDGSAQYPAQSAGLRLFVERGRAADRLFEPTGHDLAVIETICHYLEYVPLAIEIAARNLRRLTLDEITRAVTRPLDLHAPRAAFGTGRHQSLRHTLEWSFGLLDETSQQVWLRLSTFSGPFREEQALAVCIAEALDKPSVLQALDELLDSSLLSREPGGSRRLRMLQTVQAFGREKLQAAGQLERADRHHGEVFAALAARLGERFLGDGEAEAASSIYDDLPNLRSAFERAIARDTELAADLAIPLFMFNYFHRGSETGDWYRRIMLRPDAERLAQAPLILAGAAVHALHNEGDPTQAAGFIERGLSAEAAGAESSQGWLRSVAGQIELWAGRASQCIDHHLDAARQAQAAGNRACEVISLCAAAFITAKLRDLQGAEALVEQARAIEPLIHQPSLLGYISYAAGGVESFRDVSKAVRFYQLAVEWAIMGGNALGAQRVRHLIADRQAADAPPARAVAIHVRTLVDLPPHGATFYAWSSVRALLPPLLELGLDETIAILAGALQASPIKLDSAARQAVSQARTRLGDAAFNKAASQGASFDLTRTRAYIEEELRALPAEPANSALPAEPANLALPAEPANLTPPAGAAGPAPRRAALNEAAANEGAACSPS